MKKQKMKKKSNIKNTMMKRIILKKDLYLNKTILSKILSKHKDTVGTKIKEEEEEAERTITIKDIINSNGITSITNNSILNTITMRTVILSNMIIHNTTINKITIKESIRDTIGTLLQISMS